MKAFKFITSTIFALTPFFTNTALASWTLDNNNSQLHFISVKNTSVAEVNHFEQLKGKIADSGEVAVEVSLNSAETNIPLRNERVRELLFETNQFPVATITASINAEKLKALNISESLSQETTVTLKLHGKSREIPGSFKATRLSETKIQVSTNAPIILDAADYALADNLKALQIIAKLESISTAVPVTVNLIFDEKI